MLLYLSRRRNGVFFKEFPCHADQASGLFDIASES